MLLHGDFIGVGSFFGHCDRNPARQQNWFRHCFLLDFRDLPVVVRECGPDGEVPMDSFEMLQNVTFAPLPAPRYYTALAIDRDPEPLATFVERFPAKAAQRNQSRLPTFCSSCGVRSTTTAFDSA